MTNINAIILSFATIFFYSVKFSSCGINCGSIAKSTCADSLTAEWNKHDIGQNLKDWIKSITKLRSMTAKDAELFFLRKTLVTFEERDNYGNGKPNGNDILGYISNIECDDEKHYGPVWRKTSNFSGTQFFDGFLYGYEDQNGELTGDDIIFVYPDMKTVLVGRFENGQMISAKASKITAERCNKGIKEIRVDTPRENEPSLKYLRPNRLQIGNQPRVMDPYTKKNFYIGNGKKDDGVFAKRDINRGELVLYYSGLFWNDSVQALYTRNTYHNQTWEEYWDIFRNLMSFDGPMKIHIPEPSWNISNFRATLGHKVNHSFKYQKTAYGKVFHPRFGNIRSVYSTKDIKRGEEIFVNYGYGVGGTVPKWISDLYKQEMGKDWYAKKSSGSSGTCSQKPKTSNNCGCST